MEKIIEPELTHAANCWRSEESLAPVGAVESASLTDDENRYHLSGPKLYLIVVALCLSVILVALVCLLFVLISI